MCVCVYIYIHIHKNAHTYICIYVHIDIDVYMCTHILMCAISKARQNTILKALNPVGRESLLPSVKCKDLLNYYPNTFKPLNKSRKGTTPKGFKPVRRDRLPPQKL